MLDAKVSASCEGCGKRYLVPPGERTYTCKQCGGAVRAPLQDAAPAAAISERTCPQCGASNAAEDSFCRECGLGLSADAEPGRRGLGSRRRASSVLARTLRTIRVMRWLYGLHAAFGGMITLVLVVALASTEVSPGRAVLAILLTAMATAVSLVAVLQLPYQPFLWSLICAGWVTAAQVARLLQGEAPVLGWVWAALLWLLVAPTVRARRLVRENPDLYVVHRLHGTQALRHGARRAGHDSQRDMAAILARARSTAWRRSAIAVVLVFTVTALAAGSVYSQLRPRPVATALLDLRSAWSEADVDAIADLFASEHRAWQGQQLAQVFAGRGWDERAPLLLEPEVHDGGGRVRAVFASEAGEVVSEWEWAGRRWTLLSLELPPPGLEPWAERFAQAWNGTDTEALAGLFAEDSRERMAASLRSLFARREWDGGAPPIRSWEGDILRRGRAEVRFRLDAGLLITRWAARDGVDWALTSIRPPKD